jgi:hypothetical protein
MASPILSRRKLRATPSTADLYIRVMLSGLKASSSARLTAKKQVWAPTGGADDFTIEQAREKAREAIKRIRAGQPPCEVLPPNSESF